MRRSSSVNETYEGVVLRPWSFGIISTLSFCQTPTQENVVPKSIPIAISFCVIENNLFVINNVFDF
jgi:hypothetical protein